ncbi:hypothetical protein [Methylobacter sp. YRD-M1]|uniref:hypothetical protein n=1 Tax=Methylobacter sp. YRD-M1 TaxID=2911520 RepID=UPI00227A1FDB|nr:hypothetical protein [Methylobacter sp. YRD-M1]WAK00607.1 hypothetical protein LZ558_12180 [Methylobacter sp. YRD-M1]
MFDIPLVRINAVDNGQADQLKQFTLQTGLLSSVLEHAVPEQIFLTDPDNPPDAVSAVKALQKATQQGQRIYHITQAPYARIVVGMPKRQSSQEAVRHATATMMAAPASPIKRRCRVSSIKAHGTG